MHLAPLAFAAALGKFHVLDLLICIDDLSCDIIAVGIGDHDFVLPEAAVLFGFERLEPSLVHVGMIFRILAEHEVIEDHLTPVVATYRYVIWCL